MFKNNQPSELNKILLLIFTNAPILAVMYTQQVNIWIIIMFAAIVISLSFQLFSIHYHNKLLHTQTDKLLILWKNQEHIKKRIDVIYKVQNTQCEINSYLDKRINSKKE